MSMHFSDDALELYELSMLAESEAGAIEEHILVCGFCCASLERVSLEIASLREGLQAEFEQRQKAIQEKKSGGKVLMFRTRSTS